MALFGVLFFLAIAKYLAVISLRRSVRAYHGTAHWKWPDRHRPSGWELYTLHATSRGQTSTNRRPSRQFRPSLSDGLNQGERLEARFLTASPKFQRIGTWGPFASGWGYGDQWSTSGNGSFSWQYSAAYVNTPGLGGSTSANVGVTVIDGGPSSNATSTIQVNGGLINNANISVDPINPGPMVGGDWILYSQTSTGSFPLTWRFVDGDVQGLPVWANSPSWGGQPAPPLSLTVTFGVTLITSEGSGASAMQTNPAETTFTFTTASGLFVGPDPENPADLLAVTPTGQTSRAVDFWANGGTLGVSYTLTGWQGAGESVAYTAALADMYAPTETEIDAIGSSSLTWSFSETANY
jgi:hypothetical protein